MPTSFATAAMLGLIVCTGASNLRGQEANRALYRVDVNLVTFTFSVTDAQGNSVHGLQPSSIRVFEDGIPQKLASFAEGNKPIVHMLSGGQISAGTNVFILFDTSNHMYRDLPYVCDSIADFLRRLNPADAVAIYTFSRNLSRAVPLTNDHLVARAGLAQNVSAGEDTALLNCLLLTLRDAAKTPGRKVVVLFSNGPDDRSMVSPEDVGRVAEDEGIPIYVISTLNVNKDQQMGHTLRRLADRTGGKLYLARNWQAQTRAFVCVHDDIASSYTVSYYPAPNSNEGFRNINVEVVSASGKTYRIRARAGYQPAKTALGPN
jgi:Ca-activated chloride channel homolog